MNNINLAEVFKEHGLKTEEIKPGYFKIINNSDLINITLLEYELGECIIFSSGKKEERKAESGGYYRFSNIYYIFTDITDKEFMREEAKRLAENGLKFYISAGKDEKDRRKYVGVLNLSEVGQ